MNEDFISQLEEIGFKKDDDWTEDDLLYIKTARSHTDNTIHELPNGWRILEYKGIYPPLREMSTFRGYLLTGTINGRLRSFDHRKTNNSQPIVDIVRHMLK